MEVVVIGRVGGRARGSAMRVMARQTAQRMDLAPGGSCNCVRQFEQSTSINIFMISPFCF